MNAELQLPKYLLFSPWFLLVFLLLPLAVILSLTFHLHIPLVGLGSMLVNNICFALIAGCRFVWYLSRWGKTIRYGAALRRPKRTEEAPMTASAARGILSAGAFRFAAGGGYGEKRDFGYLGTTILYGGLALLLAVGCWDNLTQFSGTLFDAVGPSTKLSQLDSYRTLDKGALAGNPVTLPRIQLLSQALPDNSYPKGATEIALTPESGQTVTTLLVPGAPLHYGAYDISMSKLVFEPEIIIKTKDGRTTLFDGLVQLDPLVQKRGDFSFYGIFQGSEVVGGAYYQPEKSVLMVVITRNGKREVSEMRFSVDQQVVSGDYLLSCAKMGQWSELHVVRQRHKVLLFLGGGLALLGLILRVAFRPQRVWLEDAGGNCLVTASGSEAKRLLQL
jgi:hypothetical protein